MKKRNLRIILGGGLILFLFLSGCSLGEIAIEILNLSPLTITVTRGETFSLNLAIVPENATTGIRWETDNPQVVSINSGGLATAEQEGMAVISAVSVENPLIKASCVVTVQPPGASSLRITPREVFLVEDETVLLEVEREGSDNPGAVIWRSLNEDLVFVSPSGAVTGLNPGSCVVEAALVADPGMKAYCVVIVQKADPSEISVVLTPSQYTLDITETITIEASVTPDSGNTAVTWESNAPEVAGVVDGVVTPVSVGAALIVATSQADTSKKGFAVINVINRLVESIQVEVNPPIATLNRWDSLDLSATVTPVGASPAVIWSSGNTYVASVDSLSGRVTGLHAGDVTITATSVENPEKVGYAAITVNEVTIAVFISPTSLEIYDGTQATLSATVEPDLPYINDSVIWSSGNDAVATVTQAGVVTAQGPGDTYIRATSVQDSTKSGQCPIKVNSLDDMSITIDPPQVTIEKGDTTTLTATVTAPPEVSKEVTWNSNTPSIATVDRSSGVVTGVSAGIVWISATHITDLSVQGWCRVTVTDVYASLTVSVTPENVTILPAETLQLEATVTVTGATPGGVEWSTTNPSIASVDTLTGVVTAQAPGVVTIRATSLQNPARSDTCIVTVDNNLLIRDQIRTGTVGEGASVWYYVNGALGSHYILQWEEAGSGSYTGDVLVSAFHEDKLTPYTGFQDLDTPPGELDCPESERIWIEVKPRDTGTGGTFALSYSIDNSGIPAAWTLMLYFNTNFLEPVAFDNIKHLMNGYHNQTGMNVLLLLDRDDQDINVPDLDAEYDFTDTRLFILHPGNLERISGGEEFPEIDITTSYEANMGDAETLAKFIDFSKNNYPAQKYGLIIMGHGLGAGGIAGDQLYNAQGTLLAPNDQLHPGEMSLGLDASHSVNLLGFNACLMGNAEVAYQFRNEAENSGFSAEVMLASPNAVDIAGWGYETLFERINIAGGTSVQPEMLYGGSEEIFVPADMDAMEFSRVIIEEFMDEMYTSYLGIADNQTLVAYDLTAIGPVKRKLDELVQLIDLLGERTQLETLRDDKAQVGWYYYFYPSDPNLDAAERTSYPYYELTDLCAGITQGNGFSNYSADEAAALLTLIQDSLIGHAYYFDDTSGDHGLSIFFSNGDDLYQGQPMFSYQWWYNARDVTTRGEGTDEQYVGQLAWCADKATNTSGAVDNWFELLDKWYDPDNAFNNYQY